MAENILEKIITKKTTRVDSLKKSITIEFLKENLAGKSPALRTPLSKTEIAELISWNY